MRQDNVVENPDGVPQPGKDQAIHRRGNCQPEGDVMCKGEVDGQLGRGALLRDAVGCCSAEAADCCGRGSEMASVFQFFSGLGLRLVKRYVGPPRFNFLTLDDPAWPLILAIHPGTMTIRFDYWMHYLPLLCDHTP